MQNCTKPDNNLKKWSFGKTENVKYCQINLKPYKNGIKLTSFLDSKTVAYKMGLRAKNMFSVTDQSLIEG